MKFLKEMDKLFRTLDESKHARSFMGKLTKDSIYIKDLECLNSVFDNIPHKELDVYYKYFSTVFRSSKSLGKEDLAEFFERNPFTSFSDYFSKYGRDYKDRHGRVSLVDRLSLYIDYRRTKLQFSLADLFTRKSAKAPVAAPKTTEVVQVPSVVAQPVPEVKLPVAVEPSKVVEVPEIIKPSEPKVVEKPVKTTFKLPSIEELLNPNALIINPKILPAYIQPVRKPLFEFKNQLLLPFIPQQKPISKAKLLRAQVKEQVADYVTRKLGKKTLENQKDKYNNFATKMRWTMLPEIFSSIVDTRKADRLLGKKKSSSASNKDALTLFSMINGKNRKLVNYLLKKRKADETRMFDVKEIIDILKRAENTIKTEKYSPKEAKGYYNEIFDSNVQAFGKVKIRRTKK